MVKFVDILPGRITELEAKRAVHIETLERITGALERSGRHTLRPEAQAEFDAAKTEVDEIDESLTSMRARLVDLQELDKRYEQASRASPATNRFDDEGYLMSPTASWIRQEVNGQPIHRDDLNADGTIDSERFTHKPLGGGRRTSEARAQAFRTFEGNRRLPGVKDSTIDAMVRAVEDDETDNTAHLAAALANTDYFRGFMKLLRDPERGHLEWSPAEHAAYKVVRDAERAMSIGTTTAGGFLLPLALDPSIIISGAGSIHPFRRISSVKTTVSSPWVGVSAGQLSSSWDAEGVETSDDSPTLARPTVTTYMGRTFIPYSFELEMDANDLTGDLTELLVDAQENLEATAFAVGSGSQPQGITTCVNAITASRVAAVTGGTFGLADIFKVQNALPARHSPRASWVMPLTYINSVRQAGTGSVGGNAFWTDMSGDAPAVLLGRNAYEGSTLSATITTGQVGLVYGDFRKFVIAQHMGGARLELIPHLTSTVSGRPTGQRGLLYWSRVGSGVTDADAFRCLVL